MRNKNTRGLTADPLISVVIPNYNYGRFIKQCITSVLEQTYTNLEIVVVDDGSSDESLDVLSHFSNQITLYSQTNSGVNSARNLGIERAKGSLVALCDSDDYWHPTKLESQILMLSLNPDAALISCSVQEFGSHESDYLIRHALKIGYLEKEYALNPGVAWVPNAPSTSLFYRSAAFSCGLFDETLHGNAEDWEFFARLSSMGEFVSVQKPLVFARQHLESRSNTSLLRWYKDNLKAYNTFYGKTVNRRRLNYQIGKTRLQVSFFKTVLKFVIQLIKRVINKL